MIITFFRIILLTLNLSWYGCLLLRYEIMENCFTCDVIAEDARSDDLAKRIEQVLEVLLRHALG